MGNRKNLILVTLVGVAIIIYSISFLVFPGSNEGLLAQAILPGVSSSGWTEFTPSADTRMVYVSSSTGNDGNDGLSEGAAKKTISAAESLLRHGYPDWLLLKRGDIFNEPLGQWKMSGRSEAEPMLVSSYGTSVARPLLETGLQGGIWTHSGGGSPSTISNVAFVGLHFIANGYDGANANQAGISFLQPGVNILVEDFKIEGYATGIIFQGYGGSLQDYALRRSVIVNSYTVHAINGHSQGMYAYNVHGLLIEGNVFYHNGWSETVPGAGADIFSHNIYIDNGNTAVVLRENIVADGSSHGAQMRSGGIVENNLFVRNSIALTAGSGNNPEAGGVTIDVRDNVILDGKNITPVDPRGWGMAISNISSGTVADNIIANNVLGTQPSTVSLDGGHKGENGQLDFGIHNLLLQNNIIYNWGGGMSISDTIPRVTNISFVNNDFQHFSATTPHIDHYNNTGLSEFHGSGNKFYSSAPDSGSTKWILINEIPESLSYWKNQIGDTTSVAFKKVYVDPTRSVGSYSASVGGAGTYSAFIAGAIQQSRGSWNDAYTAAAVNNYIRIGFGIDTPPPPPPTPVVTVSVPDASAGEPSDNGTFRITRTGSTASSLAVNVTMSGSATGGSDYQTIVSPQTIPAGALSVDAVVATIDDSQAELTESVLLTLAPGTGYTVGTQSSGTVDIVDNDTTSPSLPTISVSVPDPSAAEAGLDPGTIRLTRTGATTAQLTVNFAIAGTATNGTDYQTIAASKVIPIGAAFADVTVTPFDDTSVESSETVILTVSPNASVYTVGAPSAGTVNITDNDTAPTLPTVTILATDPAAAEAGSGAGVFRVSRTGSTVGALTVTLAISGTAANGVDYQTIGTSKIIPNGSPSATITLTPIDDTLVEGSETAILTIQAAPGVYAVGSPSSETVTITDNDSPPPPLGNARLKRVGSDLLVTSAPAGAQAWVDSGTPQGANPVDILNLVAGLHTANATDVAGFTETAGVCTYPIGGTECSISSFQIPPICDGTSCSATMTVFGGEVTKVAFQYVATPPTLPTIDVTVSDSSAGEPSDNGTFRITRTGSTASTLTVNFAVSGTATNGTDYQTITASKIIPIGAAFADVNVTPIDDTIVEGDEIVTLTLQNSSAYTIGSSNYGSFTIQDNDVAPPPPPPLGEQPPPPPPSNGTIPVASIKLIVYMTSETAIRLFWSGGSAGQTGYKLEMSTDGTTFAHIRDLPPHYYFWNETGLKVNARYYYRIRAYGSAPNSAYSNVVDVATGGLGKPFAFTRSLRVGNSGNDVRVLQRCLNKNGFVIAPFGAGSPGNETSFFGSRTTLAVKKLQNAYASIILVPVGIPSGGGTGFFGPSTKAYMNTLGCDGMP